MSTSSYVTVQESDEMASMTPSGEIWLEMDGGLKLSSLSYSSKMLDSFFDWAGQIATDIQSLRWPRKNVYDRDGRLIDSTTIPNRIKEATFMLALSVSKGEIEGVTPGNLESLKIGPIALSFDTTITKNDQPVSTSVIAMLNDFGNYTGPRNSTDAYNVRAIR